MTVAFDVRLVFDEEFYNEMIKKGTNPALLRKLMYINSSAEGFKRNFNVMSKKTFEIILKKNPTMPRELLRCSFCPFDENALEKIDDDIERTVKYAIHVVKEDPKKKCMILTSDKNKEEYIKNSHYNCSRDISTKSGDEAINLINDLWVLCSSR